VAASSVTADDTELVPSSGFRIEQISFGKILSPIGISLMTYGFGAFFGLLPGGDISSIMLIYGFPISLLGFALAYAQLKPVPCKTTKAAFDLRDSQMTDIQKQVCFATKHSDSVTKNIAVTHLNMSRVIQSSYSCLRATQTGCPWA